MVMPSRDSCWRVPIKRFGSLRTRTSGRRVFRKPRHDAWAPIVTASTEALALAKAQHLYPDAELGRPVALHRGRSHRVGAYLTPDRLAAVGFV